MELGETQKAVLEHMLHFDPETIRKMRFSMNRSSSSIHGAMRRLEDRGLVRRYSEGNAMKWELTGVGRETARNL